MLIIRQLDTLACARERDALTVILDDDGLVHTANMNYQYEKYAKRVAHDYGLTLYTAKDHAATKYYHSY